MKRSKSEERKPLRAFGDLDLLMSSLLRDYLLVCERRASPSDRGQWFSALPATPHPLHGWKCPAAGPENKLC
ncbi:MAG TPA: hypothetical protein VJ805_00005, partial [Nitrospiraceae bacterium]|nr:hypothetical protein [Nitrospiraceae bacterium]